MTITDKLYTCIKKQSAPRSDRWLAKQLKVKARDIAKPLDELEDCGRIYRTDTGDYRATNEKYTYNGRVVLTAGGRAYVWLPDGRELPLEMPRRVAFAGEDVRVFLPKVEPPTALLIRTLPIRCRAAATAWSLPRLYAILSARRFLARAMNRRYVIC